MDEATEVREDYLESLQELTTASRPIISSLTDIASEYVGFAPAIVDAIDQHARTCPPPLRLPCLYLLDSVCKRQPEPYVRLFAPRVASLFIATFGMVRDQTKGRLVELFRTWTMPQPPVGSTLFPYDVLRNIDNFILQQVPGAAPPVGTVPVTAPPPVASKPMNQSSMMVEINRAIRSVGGENPNPEQDTNVAALMRLLERVSGPSVDPKTFPEILGEIERIKHRAAYSSRVPNNKKGNKQRRTGGGQNNRKGGASGGLTGTNNVPLGKPKHQATQQKHHAEPEADEPSRIDVSDNAQPQSASPPETPQIDFTQLAASINGQLRQKTVETEIPDLNQESIDNAPASDLVISLLYAEQPLQCSHCARRFPDDAKGREEEQAELDMHFRVNKVLRDGHSRNRCWFLSVDKWVEYREDDITEAQDQGQENDDVKNNVIDLDAERKKYVPIMSDGDVACGICHELFAEAWSEDAEEWVWTNCVEQENKFFHATCLATNKPSS